MFQSRITSRIISNESFNRKFKEAGDMKYVVLFPTKGSMGSYIKGPVQYSVKCPIQCSVCRNVHIFEDPDAKLFDPDSLFK